MEITRDTKVADILNEYGDIAGVMEIFGVRRVGRYSVRSLAARALTVEWRTGRISAALPQGWFWRISSSSCPPTGCRPPASSEPRNDPR